MELSQFKKSVQEIAKTVGAMVEEKLGERSHLEQQVRTMAKQVEKVVSDTLWSRAERAVIRFKKLEHFSGDLPSYQTVLSSGMDVRACLTEDVVLASMQRALIPTGLSVEIPGGFEIQVRPRSGLALSKGISVVNSPGTVDADYRGEVKIILINLGKEAVTIKNQDRIAQLVVCPVVHAEIEDADTLNHTERGEGGFGSTGI
jgi:dUTP pyrophosphatase